MLRSASPMIQCSNEDGYWSLMGLSTMTVSARAAFTSSTVWKLATTHRGNSQAHTLVLPCTGADSYNSQAHTLVLPCTGADSYWA